MAYLGDTGQGAVLKLSGSTIAMIRSMTLPEWALEKIDASTLDSTGFMKYVPGDLADPGELVAELVFDPADDIPVLGGCGEMLLLEWPINPCRDGTPHNTPATLSGSAFVSNINYGNLALNELNTLTITFTFNGEVTPAYTTESFVSGP